MGRVRSEFINIICHLPFTGVLLKSYTSYTKKDGKINTNSKWLARERPEEHRWRFTTTSPQRE